MESSDNWGPNGLGYYVASRLLWDVSEASRLDAIVDDFLLRCFGPARDPMVEFYRAMDGALWRFKDSTGTRRLMTVPPYLARSGSELLLPADVVEADRPRGTPAVITDK